MRVLGESSWCFCNGGGRSERMKGSIFCNKGAAMARVGGGTGFLIHKNLLLTTHVNLPSVLAAEGLEIRLQDRVAAKLFPHRFFITSSVLDLTIVGIDAIDGDSNAQGHQPQCLKTCSNPSLDLGSVVYLLGYTDKKELKVGEGKVVIATDNLIKVSTDGIIWSPGSAGFDAQGNLAFMVCDPMKLATSPTVKCTSASSSSSSSWKKDLPVQFGIPIPIICDWLHQHWEGSLDELNKPKLPLIRLMSTGQKSEHSCASFAMRQVFKSTEGENDNTPSSSNIISGQQDHPGPSCSAAANVCQEETPVTGLHSSIRELGIPTPEIYESPRLTSVPVRKKENTQTQLLNINFPPSAPKAIVLPQAIKKLPTSSDGNSVEELALRNSLKEDNPIEGKGVPNPVGDGEISTGSINGEDHSEVQSSSSPIEVSEWQNVGHGYHADYSSEGETMYSAETAESRNYPSPKVEKFQPVWRTHSCGSYSRWDTAQRNPVARRASLDNQQNFIRGRKMHSQGATSQRSNDYFNPTVSSIMKKRNNSEQLNKPRQSAGHSSPRWMF
ncbi:uncharacterized protein LOC122063449 [Macadamia integrifolia]|uniref:uncharacterized protein LOC122063449 n=1 Tax=Macadamia integrifolia TaxID=60698 RepID=UPI001C502480|nr:uncharacterized protein LOC122063449 [Macadamia integrifolia]